VVGDGSGCSVPGLGNEPGLAGEEPLKWGGTLLGGLLTLAVALERGHADWAGSSLARSTRPPDLVVAATPEMVQR
jgi:hypothetical protein